MLIYCGLNLVNESILKIQGLYDLRRGRGVRPLIRGLTPAFGDVWPPYLWHGSTFNLTPNIYWLEFDRFDPSFNENFFKNRKSGKIPTFRDVPQIGELLFDLWENGKINMSLKFLFDHQSFTLLISPRYDLI